LQKHVTFCVFTSTSNVVLSDDVALYDVTDIPVRPGRSEMSFGRQSASTTTRASRQPLQRVLDKRFSC